jgi:hypothetical protein
MSNSEYYKYFIIRVLLALLYFTYKYYLLYLQGLMEVTGVSSTLGFAAAVEEEKTVNERRAWQGSRLVE